MIDFTKPRRALEMYLNTYFTTVPIQFENVQARGDLTDGFIALTDVGSSNQTMGMGETVSSVRGMIVIQIYTPLGNGTQSSRTIATSLSTLLGSKTLSGLNLEEPTLESIGQVDGADYYQQNLTFPYQFFYGQSDDAC